MKVNVKKKPKFAVAGMNKWVEDSNECEHIWDHLFEEYLPGMLKKIGDGTRYGVSHGRTEGMEGFYYLTGYDVKNVEEAKTLDMDVKEFPETEYAMLELEGPVPQCLEDGWAHFRNVFFAQAGYEPTGGPEIEVYHEGDTKSAEYKMELWVPVRKTN